MDRCHGRTKSGARCKRSARKGSRFCATHASQSQVMEDAGVPGEKSQEQDSLDTLIILAVAGAALYALLAFRRFTWFL